jgi:hypothetical protein
MMRNKTGLAIILIAALMPFNSLAGNLDPPGAPSAGSGMPTLTDVYNQLTSGTVPTPAATFQEPLSEPTVGTGRTLSDIQVKLPVPDATGGATTGDVLNGRTFWGLTGGEWGKQTGGMTDNGGIVITPGTADKPIPAGYHNGTGKVVGDPSLVSSNIPVGVTIFGVAGTKKRPWGCGGDVSNFDENCFDDCESDNFDWRICEYFCHNSNLSWEFNNNPSAFASYCAR